MFARISAAIAAAAIALPALADIEVRDAYARSANQKTGAAFMILSNHGEDDVLVEAQAEGLARRIELHTHIFENGIARMREVEGGIPLPAGAEVRLERGGLHVMFMGLERRLEQGARFPLVLRFRSGAEVVADVVVDHGRKPAGHGKGHGAGHGMKHGDGH